MRFKTSKLECPICEETIVSSKMLSFTVMGLRTDLAMVGFCRSYPDIHICQNCNYVYIDETLKVDKIKVKKLLTTPSYKELFIKYANKEKDNFNPFKILYKIYQYLEIDIYEQHFILLYSYYMDNSLKTFKYFIDKVEKDLTLYKGKIIFRFPIDFYRGEYYRRIGQFNQAKEIFEKIIKEYQDENFLKIANFQLQLITKKDKEPRTIEE